MQPYQRATEQVLKQGEERGNLLSSATKTIGAIAGGSALMNRVLPLLNKLVPNELARKGLKNIDPRLEKFINGSLNNGYDIDETFDYLRNKVLKESSEEPAKESKNIIEMHSPELHKFILDHIQKGRNPFLAGSAAQKDKKFKDVIDKLTKEHKMPWADILQSVYGSGKTAQGKGGGANLTGLYESQYGPLEQGQQQPQQLTQRQPGQNQAPQQPQQDPLREALISGDTQAIGKILNVNEKQAYNIMQKFYQNEGKQQQSQGQPGPGSQALSGILQEINQKLGMR